MFFDAAAFLASAPRRPARGRALTVRGESSRPVIPVLPGNHAFNHAMDYAEDHAEASAESRLTIGRHYGRDYAGTMPEYNYEGKCIYAQNARMADFAAM